MKKLILIAIAAALGLAVLAGTGTLSYIRTSARMAGDSVKESIPMSFQIERARSMIEELEQPIRQNMLAIAREEADLERLQERIDEKDRELLADKEELLKLQADAASGQTRFVYAGRDYSIDQVKADLSNRFSRYQTAEKTLESLREIYSARTQGLEAGRKKLEAMLAARRELEVDVENLEARRQMIAAAEAGSDYQFDDSRLGQVKELVADLETRLDVAEKIVNNDQYYRSEIPVGEEAPDDIVDEVATYFGHRLPEADTVAQND
jgi:chromosome segregation ATPase